MTRTDYSPAMLRLLREMRERPDGWWSVVLLGDVVGNIKLAEWCLFEAVAHGLAEGDGTCARLTPKGREVADG